MAGTGEGTLGITTGTVAKPHPAPWTHGVPGVTQPLEHPSASLSFPLHGAVRRHWHPAHPSALLAPQCSSVLAPRVPARPSAPGPARSLAIVLLPTSRGANDKSQSGPSSGRRLHARRHRRLPTRQAGNAAATLQTPGKMQPGAGGQLQGTRDPLAGEIKNKPSQRKGNTDLKVRWSRPAGTQPSGAGPGPAAP